MTSQNKKKKARNSFINNGGEKDTIKLKRIKYYNKKQRNQIKSEVRSDTDDYKRGI